MSGIDEDRMKKENTTHRAHHPEGWEPQGSAHQPKGWEPQGSAHHPKGWETQGSAHHPEGWETQGRATTTPSGAQRRQSTCGLVGTASISRRPTQKSETLRTLGRASGELGARPNDEVWANAKNTCGSGRWRGTRSTSPPSRCRTADPCRRSRAEAARRVRGGRREGEDRGVQETRSHGERQETASGPRAERRRGGGEAEERKGRTAP